MLILSLKAWASTATLAVACACLPVGIASAAAPTDVVVASYGGSFQEAQAKAFFEPFAQSAGVKVLGTTGTGYAKVKAMIASGNVTWDVVSADAAAYESEARDGLLMPIDYSVVKADGIPPEFRARFGVGYMTFAENMAWSKAKFPGGLSPAQFFDPTVKARRVMLALPYYNLEFALLADGVKPADLYPLDVDRGLKVIDRVKDQIVGFKSPSDVQALIQQGEVDAAFAPGGRVTNAIKGGADWAYGWDAAVTVVEYWAVVKGAPDPAGAMRFIDYAVQAERQAALTRIIPYGPTDVGALKLVDPALAASLPSYPANAARGAVLNSGWWNENLAAVTPRWNTYMMQ